LTAPLGSQVIPKCRALARRDICGYFMKAPPAPPAPDLQCFAWMYRRCRPGSTNGTSTRAGGGRARSRAGMPGAGAPRHAGHFLKSRRAARASAVIAVAMTVPFGTTRTASSGIWPHLAAWCRFGLAPFRAAPRRTCQVSGGARSSRHSVPGGRGGAATRSHCQSAGYMAYAHQDKVYRL
jgi:hypothetical protein